MCCFSGRVEAVRGTKIFARAQGDRQLIVYEMSLTARGDLAMVLPIPCDDREVEFVDFSGAPQFFEHVDGLFSGSEDLALGGPQAPRQRGPLAVRNVGAFEASFVPTALDFDRLDPRFSLPSDLWARIPAVAGFGFVVFRLRDTSPAGLLARLLAPPPAPRRFHPMAFWFGRRDRERLFFPTQHVHDGTVHATAEFDHTLYAQSDAPSGEGWEVSRGSLQQVHGFARTMVADAPGHRRVIRGVHANHDLWVRS